MFSRSYGFILVQYIHHVFSNRLFQLFSQMKIDKFGIVGKRRFSSFILRGLGKNFQAKKILRQKKFYGIGSFKGYHPQLASSKSWGFLKFSLLEGNIEVQRNRSRTMDGTLKKRSKQPGNQFF